MSDADLFKKAGVRLAPGFRKVGDLVPAVSETDTEIMRRLDEAADRAEAEERRRQQQKSAAALALTPSATFSRKGGREVKRLVDASVSIRLDPDAVENAFLARQLVQATLPHKNPGDVPVWSRRNGDLTLGIVPGRNLSTGASYGYPYGSVPRLLLYWMTTEAIRTKNKRLELGHSLTMFMRQLDLNPDNGGTGAKRSDARRLRDQMTRLFFATISFEQVRTEGHRAGHAWKHMQVAPEGMLWWDEREPDQNTLWPSYIILGERFFEAITSAPVPVDMRALQALKRSPLALDLYAWAALEAFQRQRAGTPRFIAWRWLQEQFGAEYADPKDFKKNAQKALRKVKLVYPAFESIPERGGFRVLPCTPAVAAKH